ncbi:hypothetical protein DWY90_00295 [Coprococcus sp. AF27-8]|nr:hypothetical protein DWY90_00295 [Coprococcus sp. AF27-8]
MENKKRKVVLITVIILILAIIGSIGGYAIYKQNKIKERSAEVKSDIADNLEIFDKGDRNKKLEIFKKLSTNKNAYQKEEYHQKEVLDDFENTLEKMKSFFSSDYDKTLSENTLTDIDKLTDKSKIATAKENLESLLNTIESENVTLKLEKLEEKTTIAQDLIEKYTNRIKTLEEEAKKKAEEEAKKKAEEEAKKNAEEEAKKKAESAAENNSYNSGNSGNGNYSSSDSSSDNSGSSGSNESSNSSGGSYGSNESSNSSGGIYVIRTERFEVNGNYGTRYFYSDGSVKIVMDSGEVENVEDPNGDIYG